MKHSKWLLAAAILFLTFLAYQPVWHAGFVWDDDFYVTDNPALKSVDGLRSIWCNLKTTRQYYPVTVSTLWAEYHLWQLQPLGYHLVSVLIHALNAILLWRVLRRLEIPGAWLAATIFAIHPVTVESVAWISERKNLLSCLFYLLAMLAFLRFRPLTDAKFPRPFDWRFYPLLLAAFLFALLSKTVTCSLPAVLLLVVWWKKGRVEARDALATAPLFVLGVALGLMSKWEEQHLVGAGGAEWALTSIQRCLLAGRALWFYAGKLLWPRDLTFIYPHWQIDSGAAWQYAFPLAFVVVLVALWKMRSRIGRGPLAAVLFFAGTLVPALGFFDVFPFRYSFVADHFQYIASIGLIVLAVGAGTTAYRRMGGTDQHAVVVIVPLLVAFGAITWQQAHIYRDLETLWRDTLSKNPDCWMAHNNLAAILYGQGRTDEALRHCERALVLKPDDPEIYNTLAGVSIQAGKYQDAIGYCERAMRVAPWDSRAYNNIGLALVQQGKWQQAIDRFEQALRLDPNDVRARRNLETAANNLAWQLATHEASVGGDPGHAVVFARRACELTDNGEFAYLDTLAAAYANEGRFNDAVTIAQKAIELARTAGQTQAVSEIAGRLELYRSGHAYRESTSPPPSGNP